MDILTPTNQPVIDLALDTIRLKKQALIFVNTKRSAEASAESISEHIKDVDLNEFSENIKSVLASPTKQCRRLARCIKKGIAFHHSGLHSKQRELIEDGFREGTVNIICCTTTMAAGVDLPAFRSIMRDVKRYGKRGLELIPVLEYHQAAGRAGRPGKEEFGESIVIAKSEDEKQDIIKRFINGEPEKIFSKLAVEPVLRTYLLSLVVTGIAKTEESLRDFFSRTFWAKQFEDLDALFKIIDKVKLQLIDWKFLAGPKGGDFVSANELENTRLTATLLGKRVSELYLDPLAANHLIKGIKRMKGISVTPFSLLQLICSTLEMRPLIRVRQKEYDHYQEFLGEHFSELLAEEPSYFEQDYDTFLNSVKTAAMLLSWVDETDEEEIMEEFGSRPGETRYKLDIAEWLLYSTKELANILEEKKNINQIDKLRIRLKYGVKEELLPLLKLKNIGRVRARKLFRNKVKTLREVKKISLSELKILVGPKIAKDIKEQVGV